MASLLRKPGFGSLVSNMKPSMMPTMGRSFSIGYIVLYILVGGIFAFAVVMLLGIKVDLSWLDFRSKHSKVVGDFL